LLHAKPIIGQRKERLYNIPGQVPNPIGLPDNCAFSDRCENCMPICLEKTPVLKADQNGNKVACWLYEGEGVS
jgi:peptide/nickel transport system ATP-binding protein